MTDKEKLIEIIGHTPCCGFSSRKACEHIADHLIANGVTIRTADKPSEVAYNLSPTESRWIPAAERLPGIGELVLVCAGDHVDVNYREGDSTWGFDYDAPITHWMPLPEPPSVSEVGV